MFIWDRCAICDRIIPVGELCYGIKNWKGDPEGGRTICKNCIAPENVDSITPTNEPLTWSELAEMKGQPVYIVEMGARRYWALVAYVGKDTAEFVTADDPDDYGDKELYGESWVAYRRPLEGEA